MKKSELLRLFGKNDIKFVKHGAKHDLYYSPITGKYTRVPRHNTEIKDGTLHSILTDTGLK